MNATTQAQDRLASSAREACAVRHFDLSDACDARALAELIEAEPGLARLDTLSAQVAELLATRRPGDRQAAAAERVAQYIESHGGDAYGTWVYFPWRALLVRLLPEEEFIELRTDRNQLSLLPREQRALRDKRIAIVGLSVGHSLAVTLALEGVGGSFVLADPDTVQLSNTNRLAVGVTALGVNKAVLAAQRMLETDPYLSVEVRPEGVSWEDAGALFQSPPDLLFEECDDLTLKLRLREIARERGVPVITETSQRGLIDIERFDLEPLRPPFHGLLGAVDAAGLAGLSTREKGPFVLSFMEGAAALSDRVAASLVELEQSLSGWPQLASDVVFGGAMATQVARRLLLGELRESGRFQVDLSQLIADGSDHNRRRYAVPTSVRPPEPVQRASEAHRPGRVSRLEAWLDAARRAPSGGNCQPWRFFPRASWACAVRWIWLGGRAYSIPRLWLLTRPVAPLSRNLRLAAAADGHRANVKWRACEETPEVWAAHFVPAASLEPDPLAEWMHARCTNRKRVSGALPEGAGPALARAAQEAGLGFQWIEREAERLEAAEVLGDLERLRLLCRALHEEMLSELRLGAEGVGAKDGIEAASLELTPTDQVALAVLARPDVVGLLRELDRGHALRSFSRDSVRAAPAFARLTLRGRTREAFARAGVGMQRVWLTATSLGLSVHPMTAGAFMVAQVADGRGSRLNPQELSRLAEVAPRFRACFPLAESDADVLLFRVFVADPPEVRSGRRGLEEIWHRVKRLA